jgi:hypothetical protein
MTRTGVSERSPKTVAGTWLVGGLVGLGLVAAATGIWFQRQQTRRCLEFYGSQAARRIAAAPSVRLVVLAPSDRAGRLVAVRSFDVSKAPGLVHLRRGLVEDANFAWPAAGVEGDRDGKPLPAEAWDVAFVFGGAAAAAATGDASAETTVVIGLPAADRGVEPDAGGGTRRVVGGFLTVVGQPGRLALGRIGGGLEAWVRATLLERGRGAGTGPRNERPISGKPRPVAR